MQPYKNVEIQVVIFQKLSKEPFYLTPATPVKAFKKWAKETIGWETSDLPTSVHIPFWMWR